MSKMSDEAEKALRESMKVWKQKLGYNAPRSVSIGTMISKTLVNQPVLKLRPGMVVEDTVGRKWFVRQRKNGRLMLVGFSAFSKIHSVNEDGTSSTINNPTVVHILYDPEGE